MTNSVTTAKAGTGCETMAAGQMSPNIHLILKNFIQHAFKLFSVASCDAPCTERPHERGRARLSRNDRAVQVLEGRPISSCTEVCV